MATKVKLYVSTECGACEDVKTAVEHKNYEVLGVSADLEMIDIDNFADDFIFEHFPGLPGAAYGKRTCELSVNKETQKLTVDCSRN
jgi:GTP:adenosylcobinamide-phosphate guanylyltransferase